jgi:hypothetical protein
LPLLFLLLSVALPPPLLSLLAVEPCLEWGGQLAVLVLTLLVALHGHTTTALLYISQKEKTSA